MIIKSTFPEIIDFAEIGVFRVPERLAPALVGNFLLRVTELAGAPVALVGDGWHCVMSEGTACSEALMRIAAVVDEMKIPYADVMDGMLKAIACGPRAETVQHKRKARGKVWAEYFDSLPSLSALSVLCAQVGAKFDGHDVDFSTCGRIIEPDSFERDVLYRLEESPERSMPSSRLCRKLQGYPSRTLVDMKIAAIPFVLKDKGGAPRIIGTPGMQHVPEAVESFVTLHRSSAGERVMLEYRLTEETVECNSFNVPSDCREAVHGAFAEVTTGIEIRHNMYGQDARKVTGIGPAVRKMFPGYTGKESGFVLLDPETSEARVEVVGLHAHSARDAVFQMLETGILPGPIGEIVEQFEAKGVSP